VRIVRFAAGEAVAFGVVDADADGRDWVTAIDSHPFGPFGLTGVRLPLDEVRLLAPVLPSKIVGVGKNYADHAREMGSEPPAEPIFFLKPSTAVIGPGEAIGLPRLSQEVHHEAELAVVIGRLCRDVPPARAFEVVLGYTCANDVTARDLQRSDGQWARAKGFDGFAPIGPWVVTDLDPADLAVGCRVDGEQRQAGRTSQMIHPVAELIAAVSAVMTLLPGDLLLTGTPAGVGPLAAGQTVEVEIEGIGVLRNPVSVRD
jgi:2-keto-4-pentenoate hydratase/2-oxohepta-3-ene-1,7-dioic acid hydratase in catechol pathway